MCLGLIDLLIVTTGTMVAVMMSMVITSKSTMKTLRILESQQTNLLIQKAGLLGTVKMTCEVLSLLASRQGWAIYILLCPLYTMPCAMKLE